MLFLIAGCSGSFEDKKEKPNDPASRPFSVLIDTPDPVENLGSLLSRPEPSSLNSFEGVRIADRPHVGLELLYLMRNYPYVTQSLIEQFPDARDLLLEEALRDNPPPLLLNQPSPVEETPESKLLYGAEPSPVDFQRAQAAGGTYIHVNLSRQELHVYENYSHVMAMLVIVGKEDRATPPMDDYVVSLKFSPDWTPTRNSIEKDLLPSFRSRDEVDIDYTYDIYYKGKKVLSREVPWQTVQASELRLVQKPGPANSLGQVRFSLTNNQAIYLHDTPTKSLFNVEDRSLSAGCVRVQATVALVEWILDQSEQSLPLEAIQERMNRGKVNYITLRNPVPVYITEGVL